MKLLLTGSEGYVGSLLQNQGLPVMTRLDLSVGADIVTNIADIEKYRDELERTTHVIHLADRRLEGVDADNLEQNIKEQKIFLTFLKSLPFLEKVVFASSCSIYGFNESLVDEDTEPNPTTCYAESKLRVEQILRELELPHVICRFGTCFGVSPRIREDLFINQLVKRLVFGEKMEVFGLSSWRPYVHVLDFIKALKFFIESEHFGTFNVLGFNSTKEQIISIFREHYDVAMDKLEFRIGDPRNYRARSLKLDATNYRTGVTLAQGLEELVTYYAKTT